MFELLRSIKRFRKWESLFYYSSRKIGWKRSNFRKN